MPFILLTEVNTGTKQTHTVSTVRPGSTGAWASGC